MRDDQLAERYGKALFTVVAPEDLELVHGAFRDLIGILEDDKIKTFFFHPKTLKERKRRMILTAQLPTALERFVLLTIDKGRDSALAAIYRQFNELVNHTLKRTTAKVTSAIALDDRTYAQISEKLQSATGKHIELEREINPEIAGGIIIQIDGKVIDGSLSGALARLKHSLTAAY